MCILQRILMVTFLVGLASMSEMEAAIAMDNDATLLLVLFFICIYFFPVSEKEEWKAMRTKQPASIAAGKMCAARTSPAPLHQRTSNVISQVNNVST